MDRLFDKIETHIDDGISLYGAGANGQWCLDYLLKCNYKINNFIDNSAKLQNTNIKGINVISIDKFMENPKGIILITAKHAVLQILDIIKEYELKMSFDTWFYLKHKDKYENLKDLFSDNKSVEVLSAINKTMLSGNEAYCAAVAEDNMYFCLPQFLHGMREVFVDIGAYVGDTTEKFIISQNGIFDKVYAFEPGIKQLKAAKERFKRLKIEWALDKNQIICENAGIGKKTTKIFLENNNNSRILSNFELTYKKSKNQIKIFALDDYFKNTSVSFVKTDIEGAEMEMLEGAKEIIKRDKPKMAICVYHRPDDLFNITSLLKSLVPDYKFTLRQHSSLLVETILYCWI